MKINSTSHQTVRSLGGQASSPGLFGCPSITGRVRRHGSQAQAAPAQARHALTQPTPAMRLAAIQSDARERSVWLDEEQADFARRCVGARHMEFTLAMEGN